MAKFIKALERWKIYDPFKYLGCFQVFLPWLVCGVFSLFLMIIQERFRCSYWRSRTRSLHLSSSGLVLIKKRSCKENIHCALYNRIITMMILLPPSSRNIWLRSMNVRRSNVLALPMTHSWTMLSFICSARTKRLLGINAY